MAEATKGNMKVLINDLGAIMCCNYYQVWVSETADPNHEPFGFGSGFMILHKGHMYYITADHVVNAANDKFKLNPEKDYDANLLTNEIVTENHIQKAEQVQFGINKADGIFAVKIQNNGVIIQDERIDVYFKPLDEHIHTPFYTQGVKFSETDIRYGQLRKMMIIEESIDRNICPEHTFAIYGVINSSVMKGFQVEGSSIFHQGMTFKESKYNQYCLEASRNDEHLLMEEWAGLSGAAVYDEMTNKVIGMAVQYSDAYNYCWVLPIGLIFDFIDNDIRERYQ